MLRKVRHGWINLESQVYSHRNGLGFDDAPLDPSITLDSIRARLDDLVAKRESLASVGDDELDGAYEDFLESQAQILDVLDPLLSRLAEAGCFACQYGSDFDKYLWFTPDHGIQVVRGFALYASILDEITEPPPSMDAIEIFNTESDAEGDTESDL